MATVDSIFSIVIFIFACCYLKQHCWVFANPSPNWIFHRFVRIAEKERTQRNKIKIWHSLELEPKSSAFSSASFSSCFLSISAFFLCYPGAALECPISNGVCKNSTMLIQIRHTNMKKYYAIYIYIHIAFQLDVRQPLINHSFVIVAHLHIQKNEHKNT